jgi:hypothetical protein
MPTIQEETKTPTPINVIATCATITLPTQSMQAYGQGHRAVIDSGATETMTAHAELFESITHFDDTSHTQPQVMLGNE